MAPEVFSSLTFAERFPALFLLHSVSFFSSPLSFAFCKSFHAEIFKKEIGKLLIWWSKTSATKDQETEVIITE